MSDAVGHLTTFLRSGLDQPPSDEQAVSAITACHALYRDLVDVHAAFRYARFEPPPMRQRVLEWRQTAHELRVIADAATRLFVMRRHDETLVTADEIKAFDAELAAVAVAVRHGQPSRTREHACATSG
jgi:hypothetical protein